MLGVIERILSLQLFRVLLAKYVDLLENHACKPILEGPRYVFVSETWLPIYYAACIVPKSHRIDRLDQQLRTLANLQCSQSILFMLA